MKKPEVYRKMYTGAEMYRNERQERLSQQMDKLNSDFIKMLYAGGEQTEDPFDFDDLPTPPPRARRNRRRHDSDSSDDSSDSDSDSEDTLKQAKTRVEELTVDENALLRAAAEAELKAEREKKRQDLANKLETQDNGDSRSSSTKTRIQHPNPETQLDDEPEVKPEPKPQPVAEPKPIKFIEPEDNQENDSAIESESSSLRSNSSESSFESESKEIETEEDFDMDEDTEEIEEPIKKITFPSNPLGMENRLIADNQVIATDSYSHYKACYARLNGDVCWIADSKPCAKSNIVIDLVYKTKIQHIAIQGPGPQQEDLYSKSGQCSWVTQFYVQHSSDKQKWKLYKQHAERQYMTTYDACSSINDCSLIKFDPPIESRYLKIVPTKTQDQLPAAMRFELYGNKSKYQ